MPSQINPPPCLFESTSSGPASIHNHHTNSPRTSRRSQSRIIRSSNLAITERCSSVHTSQPKYSFHLPLQPSSRPSRTTQNHQPFVGSSPSPPLFCHRVHPAAHSIAFHHPLLTASESLFPRAMSQLLSNSFASLQDNDDEELQLEDTSLIATPLSIKTPCTVMSTNNCFQA